VASFVPWEVTVLAGWIIAAVVFTGWIWLTIGTADAERTAALATLEDDSRTAADLVLLSASVISLVAVGFALVKAAHGTPGSQGMITSVAVASVVLAWFSVQTVFTLRYARIFYQGDPGMSFHEDDRPDYRDFAYVSFTIGMTYQVSDTDLTTKPIRRVATRHALLSYLFGTAIVAMTINVVATLLSK
jgi:uncharacterized membrane protein